MRYPLEENPSLEDLEELKDLDPEPWMLELLNLNPSYCSWGPNEEYMAPRTSRDPWSNTGWDRSIFLKSWKEFREKFYLDDLNEVVNFYFEIERTDILRPEDPKPPTRVLLNLWYNLPRKSCCKGIQIDHLQKEDLPEIYAFLSEANQWSREKFSPVVDKYMEDKEDRVQKFLPEWSKKDPKFARDLIVHLIRQGHLSVQEPSEIDKFSSPGPEVMDREVECSAYEDPPFPVKEGFSFVATGEGFTSKRTRGAL